MPAPEALPELYLYMDQVLALVNPCLDTQGGEEVALTRAMINNYCKSGVIPRPEKKKYTSGHVLSMLLAQSLKGVFTLDEIRVMLSAAGETGLADAYKSYVDCLRETVEANLAAYEGVEGALRLAARAQAGRLCCLHLLADRLEADAESRKDDKKDKKKHE